MGITASTTAIEATKKIGEYEGSASYNREENVASAGLDIGIAEIGVTTDHGGAVVIGIDVGIIGMNIEWGREGGIVDTQVGFGLFEVKVEAKDCVVTERKLIAGQVVATRTYRDPGCKPEPEPEPQPTPTPSPTPSPTGEASIPDDLEMYWVVIGEKLWFKKSILVTENLPDQIPIISDLTKPTVLNPIPFSVEKTLWSREYPDYFKYRFRKGQYVAYSYERLWGNPSLNPAEVVSTTSIHSTEKYEQNPMLGIGWRPYSYSSQPLVFFGSGINLNKVFTRLKEIGLERLETEQFGLVSYSFPVMTIPVKPSVENPPPRLPTGNTPPMKNDCCEEVNDKLDDLLEIIDVKRFKKDGFPLPAYLLAPGCNADAAVKNKTYYDLMQQVFRAIAHTAIVNPEVSIADNDSAKAGNQLLQIKYLSATGWAEGVTKLLLEAVDDGNVGTNCDIRTGVTVTQLLVAVADLSYKVDAIIDCIGVTTKRSKATVTTSYNLVVDDGSKGFGKESQQQIDKNTDLSTEALLPQLLRTRENTIVKEEIHPKSQTLVELLQTLLKSANK